MESFTGNQRKLEETKEDWKKKKSKSVDKIAGFLQRKQGWEISRTISLEDNNTDLSSYFRVDKKKVLCYTKFTK